MKGQLGMFGLRELDAERGVENGREVYDAYWTPSKAAEACTRALADLWTELGIARPDAILEPSVGGGAWVRAFRKVWGTQPKVYGADLDPHAPGLADHRLDQAWPGQDYLTWTDRPSVSLTAGNPPYSDIQPWLDEPLTHSSWVAWLLRGTALGSKKRRDWYKAHPPRCVWVLSPRCKWEGPGARDETDTVDPYFIAWEAGYQGPTELRWLGW